MDDETMIRFHWVNLGQKIGEHKKKNKNGKLGKTRKSLDEAVGGETCDGRGGRSATGGASRPASRRRLSAPPTKTSDAGRNFKPEPFVWLSLVLSLSLFLDDPIGSLLSDVLGLGIFRPIYLNEILILTLSFECLLRA